MAILAVLDFDDQGTLKIRNAQNALEELGATVVKSNTTIGQSSQQVKQQKSALDDLVGSARAAHQQTLLQAQALGILNTQAKVGAQVTPLQARAWQDLSTHLSQNTALATKFAPQLATINSGMQAGSTVSKQMATALGQVSQGFHQTHNIAYKTSSSLDTIKKEAGALNTALLALGAGGLANFLQGAAQLAARIETLGVVTTVTAKNAGFTTAELKVEVEAIKSLGITTQEATDSVLQFVRSNLKLSDAAQIARAAQDLAVVSGENSSATYKRLTAAIQTSETMLLRQVGIVTTNEQMWREYAKTVGKNVDQLTQMEKRQATVNKILEEARKVTGAYEISMSTAGKMQSSMARLTEELNLKLGQALLPTYTKIIKTQFEFLESLSKIDPAIIRVVAALGSFIAIMVAAAAAISAAKILGLAAAFTALLSPIGAVIAAVALLTAGWIYWNSTSEQTVDVTFQQMAALEASNSKLETTAQTYKDLTDKGVVLSANTKDLTEDQKKLKDSTDSLAKMVPTAIIEFDKLTGTYKLNVAEIEKVIGANERLMDSYVTTANSQIGGQRRKLAELETERDQKIKLLHTIEDRIGILESKSNTQVMSELRARIVAENSYLGFLSDRETMERRVLESQRAGQERVGARVAEIHKEIAALTSQIQANENVLAEFGGTIPDRIKRIQEGVTKGWDKFVEDAKRVGVSLKEALDPAQQVDPSKYRELLKGLVAEVQTATDKAAANQKQYAKSFETALNQIRNTSTATRAQLAAIDQGLGEVNEGTEEYRLRLLRASGAIEQYNKASEKTKVGLDNLAKAAEQLKEIQLEDWLRPFADEADKMVVSVGNAMHQTSLKITTEVSDLFRKLRDEEEALQRDIADKILESDREVYEKVVVSKMKAVDQAVYQERRRIEDIERAVSREIEARERALRKAREEFEEKVRLAKLEVQELQRNVQLQFDLRAEAAIAERGLQTDQTEAQRAAQRAALQSLRQHLADRLSAMAASRIGEIEAEADIGRRRLQANEDLNNKLGQQQRDALERQKEASFQTQQEIRRDYSATFQLVAGLSQQTAEIVAHGFLSMLTGAKSFKDAFVDIFRSLRDTVLNIINDIVKNWITNAAKMATGAGGFDIGKFLGGLFGFGKAAGGAGGGVLPSAGGVGSSTWNAAAGIGGSAASGAALVGKTPWWTTTAGGAFLGGAAGGLVGWGVGSATGNRWAGVGAGMGTGAAVGGMLGGPIGAGVGALVGGVAGWVGAKRENIRTNDMRDEFVEAAGGLAELNKQVVEAGYNLDKFLKVGTRSELAKEIEKIQKALEKVELEKMKDGLVKSAVAMDDLGRRAQLVGFDMNRIWNAKTIEEFNKAQEDLNKLLEEQQRRLQGLSQAAGGLQQRIAGMQGKLQKELDGLLKGMSEDRREVFEKAFEKGGLDEVFKRFQQEAKEGGREGLDFTKDQNKLREFQAHAQESLDRIGLYATSIFANIMRETGDWVAAMEAIGPSLDTIAQMQEKFGLKTSESLQKLLDFRKVLTDNEDVALPFSGITNILKGLSEAGQLTKDMFNTLGADAVAQFDELIKRGVSVNDAMLMSQPTLQALYEAQKNYGYATDEATQKLIDQAREQGLVGDQFQSIAQKQLDMLLLIAEALGATIPDAYKRQRDTAVDALGDTEGAIGDMNQKLLDSKRYWKDMGEAAEAAGRKAEDAATGAAEGHSPTGIKQIVVRLDEVRSKFALMGNESRNILQDMESKAGSIIRREGMEWWQRGGRTAPPTKDDLEEIRRERNKRQDREGEVHPLEVHVNIEGSKISLDVKAIDKRGVKEFIEEEVKPELEDWFETNNGQIITKIGDAMSRFKRGA